jgi:sigma-B regulation protein RsbU (phosphoserine phosphatase)
MANVIAGLDAGASDYLTKPFDAGELRVRIEIGRRLVETQGALAARVDELRRTTEQVDWLRSMLPICTNCQKVRDDRSYWDLVVACVREHAEADVSHGLCPACVEGLNPAFGSDGGSTRS